MFHICVYIGTYFNVYHLWKRLVASKYSGIINILQNLLQSRTFAHIFHVFLKIQCKELILRRFHVQIVRNLEFIWIYKRGEKQKQRWIASKRCLSLPRFQRIYKSGKNETMYNRVSKILSLQWISHSVSMILKDIHSANRMPGWLTFLYKKKTPLPL